MKRCPECEFVYEDEQQLCDMDGAELLHDLSVLTENSSSPLRLSFAVQTEADVKNEVTSLMVIANSSLPQVTHYRRRLAGVAIGAAVLSAALSLAYITSRHSYVPSDPKLTETTGKSPNAIPPEGVEEQTLAPADTSSILPEPGTEASAIDPAQTPTGIESPKATPRVQNSQGRNGNRNHRSGSGEPTSTSRSKIVGPVTTVTTVRMTDKGAAISTRSDGPAQTTLRAPSTSAKRAPARAEKKESRVGSFLRTTRRILKKPFN